MMEIQIDIDHLSVFNYCYIKNTKYFLNSAKNVKTYTKHCPPKSINCHTDLCNRPAQLPSRHSHATWKQHGVILMLISNNNQTTSGYIGQNKGTKRTLLGLGKPWNHGSLGWKSSKCNTQQRLYFMTSHSHWTRTETSGASRMAR